MTLQYCIGFAIHQHEFATWKNINSVLTVWELKGCFDFLLHVLPISFNVLFHCFIYNFFFPQQISLTGSKVMHQFQVGKEPRLPPPSGPQALLLAENKAAGAA